MDVLISPNDFVLGTMYAYKPHVTPISDLSKLLGDAVENGRSFLSPFITSSLKGKCRQSSYNFFVHTKSGYIVYNTLYNSLVRLQEDEYDMFSEPENCPEDVLVTFVKNGLFINKLIDEKESYLLLSDILTRHISGKLNLTITTTLKCNAHCPYCYERGVKKVDMFPGAADKILRFVLNQENHDKVDLTWFGGEPLLNTALIDEVCAGLSASGIEFSSFLITNGSLFDDSIFEKMISDWHLENVQVSLDGTSDIYNRVKSLSGTKADFYSILYSIRQLAKSKIHVGIRLNISRSNFDDILKLVSELDYVFSSESYVSYYPAFVVGTNDSFLPEEKTLCLKKLLSAVTDSRKITAETRFYSLPRTHSCHNSNPSSFSIDVFGNVFSCEHHVGREEKALASLENYSANNDPRLEPMELHPKCSECLFLPKCFGGCAANREVHNDPCQLEKYLIPAYMELL